MAACTLFASRTRCFGFVRSQLSFKVLYYSTASSLKSEADLEIPKSAIFHPRSRLLEPQLQALYLTKSALQPGLPTHLNGSAVDEYGKYPVLMQRFQSAISQSVVFCYEPSPKLKVKQRRIFSKRLRKELKKIVRKENFSSKLLMNVLQICSTSKDVGLPSPLDMVFAYQPAVKASWTRDENITVTGRIGHLLSSRHPITAFADETIVDESAENDLVWSEVISPFIHLYDKSAKMASDHGFHGNTSFRHPHTIVFPVDSERQRNPQSRDLVGQGIFYCCARAMAHALNAKQGQLGMERIPPISVQYLGLSNNKLTVVCFQLNTLDMTANSGVKNMVWIEPEISLFDNVELVAPVEGEEATVLLSGFNPSAVGLLLQLFKAPLRVDM